MSPNSGSDTGEPDLERHYSGYLILRSPSTHVLDQLGRLASEYQFVDVSHAAVEIEYRGRDTDRTVVRGLRRLAQLVQNADGEVRCEISGDTDQLWFEFYRIRDGRLYKQNAEVIRQPEEEAG